jgi:hypothetical protein
MAAWTVRNLAAVLAVNLDALKVYTKVGLLDE